MQELKNRQEFVEFMNSDEPFSVIYVYSDSCQPCKHYEPQLEELSQQYKFIRFAKTNVTSGIIKPYALPTTVIVSSNGILGQTVGGDVKELQYKISRLLQRNNRVLM